MRKLPTLPLNPEHTDEEVEEITEILTKAYLSESDSDSAGELRYIVEKLNFNLHLALCRMPSIKGG